MSNYITRPFSFDGKNKFIIHETLNLIAVINEAQYILITNTAVNFTAKIPNKYCIHVIWHPTRAEIVLFLTENICQVYKVQDNEAIPTGRQVTLESTVKDCIWIRDMLIILSKDYKILLCRFSENGDLSLEVVNSMDSAPVKLIERGTENTPFDYLFLIGTAKGTVYSMNDIDGFRECYSINDSIIELFDFGDKVITITNSFFIYFHKMINSEFIEINKFKIAGNGAKSRLFFVKNKYLGVSEEMNIIKIYDLINEETDVIDLRDGCQQSDHYIKDLAYSPHKDILVVLSEENYVFVYKMTDLHFQKKSVQVINISADTIRCGFNSNLILLESPNDCVMLSEQPIICDSDKNSAVLQICSNKYLIRNENDEFHLNISFDAVGVSLNNNSVVFWSGSKVITIKIVEGEAVFQTSFDCPGINLCTIHQSIYYISDDSLLIVNVKGQAVGELKFTQNEGRPVYLSKFNNYLIVTTELGYIELFDCNSGIPLKAKEKINVLDFMDDFGEFVDVKCNSNASCISFIAKNATGEASPTLFVVNLSNNSLSKFPAHSTRHCWDVVDDRFLTCDNGDTDLKILIRSNSVIKEFESLPIPPHFKVMLSFSNLRTWFVSQTSCVTIEHVCSTLLELNLSEKLMEFAFLLVHGKIEEVFKSIRHTNDKQIWLKMAKLCVKSGKIKLCLSCLAKLEDTRSLLAYRSVKDQSDQIVLSVLAACLGEDYEQILLESKNYRMLVKIHEASGRWDKAIEAAAKYDKLRLPVTKFNRAMFDEFFLNYKDCFSDVLDNKYLWFTPTEDSLVLLKQIIGSSNKCIARSFAEALIHHSKIKAAISVLNDIGDYENVVQLLSSCGKVDQALEVAAKCQNPVCYSYVAKHYENGGDYSKGVDYYTQSKCYSKAIGLLRNMNKLNEMARLADQASFPEMRRVALEIENINGMEEKALNLFQNIGDLPKSFEIADKLDQLTSFQSFTDNLLNDSEDTELMGQFALYFLRKGHVDKAINGLISSDQLWTAVELCNENKITPTDRLVEAIVTQTTEKSEDHRGELAKLASTCMNSAKYEQAGRIYMLIGMPQQALKALIRAGNTEKVVMLANLSRDPQLYIMAGNYLQTQNWIHEPELLKNIIKFYSKAKAFNLMGTFYATCAQVEINEYEDYSKAISSWSEAILFYDKAKLTKNIEDLRNRIRIAEKFVRILNMPVLKRENDCLELLGELDLEKAVRAAHVHSCLLETYYHQKDWELAYRELDILESEGKLKDCVDIKIVNDIKRQMGFDEEVSQVDDIEDLCDTLSDRF